MKTLKKTLAVILALAMILGMTVSASAAFSDADKITDKEAVEVMNTIGVFIGSNGAFDPQGNLTREQAAKIVAYLMLGEDVAEALPAQKVFEDVDATRWSAKYVAYCAAEGIIAGVGNNKFDPTANVTGYQFGKMLLCCLGYDADIEQYVGSNWQINVAKAMSANGIAKKAKNEAGALNREQAARYALNALKAVCVEYKDKGTKITINGAEIVTGASNATPITTGYAAAVMNAITAETTPTLQLGEKLYEGDLTLAGNASIDEYGRPGHTWKFKDGTKVKTAGTYADAADLTYTTAVKGVDLAKDIKDAGLKATGDVTLYRNGGAGSTIPAATIAAALTSTAKVGANGCTTEVFDADGDGIVDTIAMTVEYLGKVVAIGKDNKNTVNVDERSLQVSANGCTLTITAEDKLDNFDAIYDGAVVNKTKVVVTPVGDNSSSTKSLTIAAPEKAEGPVTYVGSSKLTINGTSYDIAIAAPYATTKSTQSATVYLNSNGYAIGFDGPAASGDKTVAVTKVYYALNDDSEMVQYVKGITSNGEEKTFTLEGTAPTAGAVYKYAAGTVDENATQFTAAPSTTDPTDTDVKNDALVYLGTGAIAATTKSVVVDTDYTTVTSTAPYQNAGVNVSSNALKGYFTSDVKFIFIDGSKTVVKEGVSKTDATGAKYAVLKTAADDTAVYIDTVYVIGTTVAETTDSTDVMFVLADSTPAHVAKVVDGKDKTFYEYTAYIEGAEVSPFFAKETSVSANGFYTKSVEEVSEAYVLTGNTYTKTTGKVAVKVDKTISAINAQNIVTIDSVEMDLTGATIVDCTNLGGDVSSVTALDGVNASAVVSVIFNADTGVASYVYVTAY